MTHLSWAVELQVTPKPFRWFPIWRAESFATTDCVRIMQKRRNLNYNTPPELLFAILWPDISEGERSKKKHFFRLFFNIICFLSHFPKPPEKKAKKKIIMLNTVAALSGAPREREREGEDLCVFCVSVNLTLEDPSLLQWGWSRARARASVRAYRLRGCVVGPWQSVTFF